MWRNHVNSSAMPSADAEMREPPAFRTIFGLLTVCLLLSCCGCNTLASLGLPVATSSNTLLRSAKKISESAVVASPIPKELNESVLATYYVEPGDVLYIEPAKFDSPVRLPGDQPVQPDGSVSLGSYGNMMVVNKTIPQIRQDVQERIESMEPECGPINVRLIDWESKTFYVLGEVNSPGAFRFDGNETALDAILEAGGLSRKADSHRVILSRPSTEHSCRIVLPICYNQIVQLGDTSTNYQLMPGDRIFVSGVSFADDLRRTLLPFLEPPCPRCSSEPCGCDPRSLTMPTTSFNTLAAPRWGSAPANPSDEYNSFSVPIVVPPTPPKVKKQVEMAPETLNELPAGKSSRGNVSSE
jgi:polysaccharide export outer membrane protein